MIAMLMRDAHAVQIPEIQPYLLKMSANPPGADAGIDQDSRLFGGQKRAVSAASTGKITKRDFRHWPMVQNQE